MSVCVVGGSFEGYVACSGASKHLRLDERVDDALGVDHHVNLVVGRAEEVVRLDHLPRRYDPSIDQLVCKRAHKIYEPLQSMNVHKTDTLSGRCILHLIEHVCLIDPSGVLLPLHTSSPLFIMVAESTVILAPMSQLGCLSASATVTCREAKLALTSGNQRRTVPS